MAETMYVIHYKNGGSQRIKAEYFLYSPDEDRVEFFVGKELIAMFNLNAIIGFFKMDRGDDNG